MWIDISQRSKYLSLHAIKYNRKKRWTFLETRILSTSSHDHEGLHSTVQNRSELAVANLSRRNVAARNIKVINRAKAFDCAHNTEWTIDFDSSISPASSHQYKRAVQ